MPDTIAITLCREGGPVANGNGVLVNYADYIGDDEIPPHAGGQVGLFSPWPDELTWDVEFSVYIPAVGADPAQWAKPSDVDVLRFITGGHTTSIGILPLILTQPPDVVSVAAEIALDDVSVLVRERAGNWPQVVAAFSPALGALALNAVPAGLNVIPPAEFLARPTRAEFIGDAVRGRSLLCILLRRPD